MNSEEQKRRASERFDEAGAAPENPAELETWEDFALIANHLETVDVVVLPTDFAQQLQRETLASINTGRVPAPFQEHLASAANDLVSRIRCVPPAQPKDRGKHKGREKKKKQNEEND